jgi:hypothetical protein
MTGSGFRKGKEYLRSAKIVNPGSLILRCHILWTFIDPAWMPASPDL